LVTARRITPAVEDETPPSSFKSALPSAPVRWLITARRSLISSSGRFFWSAKWKIRPSVDSWVLLSPNTFDSRIGPKESMAARMGTPVLCPARVRYSTGKVVGVH